MSKPAGIEPNVGIAKDGDSGTISFLGSPRSRDDALAQLREDFWKIDEDERERRRRRGVR